MAIAKRPKRDQSATNDVVAERFISGVGKQQSSVADEEPSVRRVPTMIRFDRDLLAKVDAEAKRRGVSRSAWVQYTLSQVLEQGGR
jgi:hypothetical protein